MTVPMKSTKFPLPFKMFYTTIVDLWLHRHYMILKIRQFQLIVIYMGTVSF